MKQILLILAVVMMGGGKKKTPEPQKKAEASSLPELKQTPSKGAKELKVEPKEPLTEAEKARKKLYDLTTKMEESTAKLIKARDLRLSMPEDSPQTREIVRRLALLNKQASNLISELFVAELEYEKAINEARNINPRPPANPVKPLPAGDILFSESEVRVDPAGRSFFTYKRIDDVKLLKLNMEITKAKSAEEDYKLAGKLTDLLWDNALPYTGKLVDFWDKKRFHKKREEIFDAGKRHGIATWWHANGQKHFEGKYIRGLPQGRTIWYREDGAMEYMGFWENGKLLRAATWGVNGQKAGEVVNGNGTLVYFHPNGKKRLEETFSEGRLSRNKFWDKEGKSVESAGVEFIPPLPR